MLIGRLIHARFRHDIETPVLVGSGGSECRAGRFSRGSAVLSPAPGQDHHSGSARDAIRHRGPRHRGQAVRGVSSRRLSWKHVRRRRQCRSRVRRQGSRRWLHAPHGARHDVHGEPKPLQEAAVRSLADFTFISIAASGSNMLVVHPSIPVNSVAEFVAYAKREPIAYAHGGNGSPGHLCMEYFRLVAGFQTTPVPYRGNPQLVTDLVAGQIKFGFVGTGGVAQHVRAGRLKGLAISTRKRSPFAPDLPTIAEIGYPDFEFDSYHVLAAPAGLPEAVAELLEREVQQALASPELQEKHSRARHRDCADAQRGSQGPHQVRFREMGQGGQGDRHADRLKRCAMATNGSTQRGHARHRHATSRSEPLRAGDRHRGRMTRRIWSTSGRA